MTGMQDEIRGKIAKVAGVGGDEVKREHPELEGYGDYSTNVALVLKGGRPMAEKIAGLIKLGEVIAKVEVAGPGFINIWLQNDCLGEELNRVITEGRDYGRSSVGQDKRVIVEYSSPNIAKPFGIGHLRSTII